MARGRTEQGRLRAAALVAALFAFLVGAPALGNRYAYDDGLIARGVQEDGRENPLVAQLQPPWSYFGAEYWTGCGRPRLESTPLYRPVTVLSFALVRALAAGTAAGADERAAPWQHGVNLLLHAAAAALLALLLLRQGFGAPHALLFAALFAAHPLHVEAVASLTGRAECLALFFGLAALWVLVRARPRALPAASVLLFLAFCSKENALGWCVAAPALAFVAAGGGPGGRRALGRAALAALPALALWAGLRAAAFHGLSGTPEIAYVSNPIARAAPGVRIPTALEVFAFGCLRLVWPLPLAADHGPEVFTPHAGFLHAGSVAGLALLAGLSAGALLGLRRARLSGAGLASLLAFALIPANLIVPIGTLYAERLWLMPSLGFVLALAALGEGLRRRSPRAARVFTGLLAVATAAGAAVSAARAPIWRDDATLFLHDVAVRPRSLMLRLQAAIQARRAGDLAAWRRHLEAATKVQPEFGRAWLELGAGTVLALDRKAPPPGRADGGAAHPARAWLRAHAEEYERGYAMIARAARCRILEARERPLLLLDRAVAACRTGRDAEARRAFLELFRLRPADRALQRRALGAAFGHLPDTMFENLLARAPALPADSPEHRIFEAKLAFRHGDLKRALQLYRASLGRGLAWPLPRDHLAWAALERRFGDPATAARIEARFR